MILYKKHNYLNKDIKFINNSRIYEYDMKNAGLSILKHYKLISLSQYNNLMENYDKHSRDVIVGKFLRKNKKVSERLMELFIDCRGQFFEDNQISNEEVLSIKKDAIFLINKKPIVTRLNEDCMFRLKHEYNSYIYLMNKEFYYNLSKDELDIKGFSDEIKDFHSEYLFKFVKECLKLKIMNQEDELFIKLLEFKDDFINKRLNINYYKDLITNTFIFENKKFGIMYETDYLNENDSRDYLLIDNNLNFIIELINNILK